MRPLLLILFWLLLPAYGYGLEIEIEIEIEGWDRGLEANIRSFLSIEQEKARKGLTASRLRFLHARAEKEIRNALRPFGYFKPRINAQLQQNGQKFRAIYQVEPGPLIRLRQVEFQILGEGKDDPLIEYDFPLMEGDILDQVSYEQAKQNLLSQVVEQGYIDARYSVHQVRVDMDQYQASIMLQLDTGKPYRFGEIRVTQDFMNPEFLARYLDFKPGDPFSHEKLLTLQSNLINSEYFSQVDVLTLREQTAGDQVPVEVVLSPSKRTRYRIGLGYSTDTGPRITLDWHRRRIGQNGHRMLTELRLSQKQSTLKSEYVIPLERPSKDSLSYGASLENIETDTHSSDIILLNITRTKALDNHWRRTLGLDYSYERFLVGDQEDLSFILAPNVMWSHIKADEQKIIQRGHRLDFRIEGAADQLLSNTNYLQASSNGKLIHGFGGGDWRLLARTQLGTTLADELQDLPASKRFFAGGDNSVRGYAFDELGPKDEDGEVIGGRYLAVASVELERHISGNWGAALFYDAGNAFDPEYVSGIESSAGIGVRWHSMVGPVRFDLAFRINADDPGGRLHVVVGPEL
ncbi:MAG: autotransporter assembly complex family protein [Pseudomonadota bacterium]